MAKTATPTRKSQSTSSAAPKPARQRSSTPKRSRTAAHAGNSTAKPARKPAAAKKTAAAKPAKKAAAPKRASKKSDAVVQDFDLQPELQALIEAGKSEGSLDGELVASTLGTLDVSPTESARFYDAVHASKIEIEDEVEDEVVAEAKADDPFTTDGTRLYYNDIRKRKLLSREEEVVLAKNKEAYVEYKYERLPDGKGDIGKEFQKDHDELKELKAEIEQLPEKSKARRELTTTYEERREQLRIIEASKRAFDDMTTANLRLVVSIAKRYQSSGLPLMDLCQEGNLGLVRAIEKFDYRRGFKLSTYATWWIRQAITRGIAEQRRTIRIPVHQTEKINKYRRTASKLAARYGRDATLPEIAKAMKEPLELVEKLTIYSQETTSLNIIVGDEGGDSELGDLIADDNAAQPDEQTLDSVSTEVIHRALERLSLVERNVIMLRFGIGGDDDRTLEGVGLKLGLTRERIRVIEREALKKLKGDGELSEMVDMTIA